VVFESFFAAGDNHQDIADAGTGGFLNHILNHGAIEYGEHFLGNGLGGREHAGAETGGGDHCFADGHVLLIE